MTGEHALLLMHDYMATQMPEIDAEEKLAGLISMEEILAMPDMDVTLEKLFTNRKRIFIHESAHVLEVMKIAITEEVKIVPVLSDEDERYIGMISAESCLKAFAEMNAVMEEGGVIELEMPLKEYQLSEITRIAEANDSLVLATYTNINSALSKVTVTLKLNTNDLAAVVSAFERYEYSVKAIFNETTYTEDVKERYDALMRFLNV